MSDEEKVLQICAWMGWRVHEWNTANWVLGSDPRPVASTCGVNRFDPFTDPGHCARVMEAADKRGWYSKIEARGCHMYDAVVVTEYGSGRSYKGEGLSRWEAFCNALLAAIGDGRHE